MLTPDGHHAMMPVINVYEAGGGMVDPTRMTGKSSFTSSKGASS